MQSLPWYINRLGRMSAAEIAWRAGRVARTVVDRLSERLTDRWTNRWTIVQAAPLHVPQPAGPTANFIRVPQDLAAPAYEKRVERIMNAGRYPLFHLPSCQLGTPPDWNRDPLTGCLAPMVRASSLDY